MMFGKEKERDTVPQATGKTGRSAGRLGGIYQLLFSIYASLLTVSLNVRIAHVSWSTRLTLLYVSWRYPHAAKGIDDPHRESLAAFLIVWFLALAIFLLLRLLARLSFPPALLRTFGGWGAVGGFPLACLYAGDGRFPFLELELACVLGAVILYAYGKWKVSMWLGVPLLVLHFLLWTMFSGYPPWPGWILLWPGWTWFWQHDTYASSIYSLLGLCSALVWSLYIKEQTFGQVLETPSP